MAREAGTPEAPGLLPFIAEVGMLFADIAGT
jgi:hypothetical protein